MRKIILLIIFLSINNAYPSENIVYAQQFIENRKTYTYTDNVKVIGESIIDDSDIIDTLPIGYEVKIIKVMKEESVLRGYKQSWCLVEYVKNDRPTRGHVRGGSLSIGYLVKDENYFLIGLDAYLKEKGFTGECKLLKNNKLISSLTITPPLPRLDNEVSTYYYNLECSILSNPGLEAFDNIIRLFFYPPYDGDVARKILIGTKNQDLFFIASERHWGEGAVGVESERYIFPNEEGGIKDRIIYIYEEYQFDDDQLKDVLVKREEKQYLWENNKLVQLFGK